MQFLVRIAEWSEGLTTRSVSAPFRKQQQVAPLRPSRGSFPGRRWVGAGDVAEQLVVVRRHLLEGGDPRQLQQLPTAFRLVGANQALVEAAERALVEGPLLVSDHTGWEGLRLD